MTVFILDGKQWEAERDDLSDPAPRVWASRLGYEESLTSNRR